MTALESDDRLGLLASAKRNACDCGTWFLWRLRSGGGWHCYACEPMPQGPGFVPARDIEILNVERAPLAVLRELLLA
jgi:hypothetical protein